MRLTDIKHTPFWEQDKKKTNERDESHSKSGWRSFDLNPTITLNSPAETRHTSKKVHARGATILDRIKSNN